MENKTLETDLAVDEKTSYSDDSLYNINSWGADFSFRELINMYDDNDLNKPELQRKYVWGRVEASRFIDSILLGLPVPSIFLAKCKDETMLIVDGYQRLMTVRDFLNGVFSGDGKIFALSNTENINKRWRGKTFQQLQASEQRKIRTTTIHSIIFEQKMPDDDTAMFQIFERINTGGQILKPQEIRNCVYQGKCNSMLIELNKNEYWRMVLDMPSEDSRMSDMELILRYFAIKDLPKSSEKDAKQIILMKYLNQYMSEKTKTSDDEIATKKEEFKKMIECIFKLYGKNAFRKKNKDGFQKRINQVIYDAVAIATANAIKENAIDYEVNYIERYKQLLDDQEFKKRIQYRTTDIVNIKRRIQLASEKLYGVSYEW